MDLAIIGFPQSGKSTVFRAVTGGRGEAARGDRVTLGVVKVPDGRLDALAAIFNPQRVTPAEVRYLDMPVAAGFGEGKGIEGQFLNDLAQAAALVHVLGVFQGPSGPETIRNEVASMGLELAFSDLGIIERRLKRIESSSKGAKDRAASAKEVETLRRLKGGLEAEVPARDQDLSPEEATLVRNYGLLTAKPVVGVLNVSEAQLPLADRLADDISGPGGLSPIVVCGSLEADVAEMEADEAREFLEDAGIGEPALHRMARRSCEALGLVTFFTTVGPTEVRAWVIPAGSTASQAAGKVHTDMERGFIRAEVVTFDDIVEAGSFVEARKRGILRVEGKSYAVEDGDVITFLFNV